MARLIREYGKDPINRGKMAKAARRSIERDGDDSTYHNAINSLTKANCSKEEMQDYQDKFEKNENRIMKQQIKLSEGELHQVIKGAVESLLKEYTDFDKVKMYGRPTQYEDDDFNEQPANNIASNESRQYKVNETQLHDIIKESVMMILKESGETHRFGQGKYGLAMDASSKAKSLGRHDQADNLRKHGVDAFNKEFSTPGFEMDEYGQLRHVGTDGIERMYRPQSKLNNLKAQLNLQGGKQRYDDALRNNSFIKHSAQSAKAYPRKKMTGGINAIDNVDNGIHGNNS